MRTQTQYLDILRLTAKIGEEKNKFHSPLPKWVLSRDLSNFLQYGLETFALSSFNNLLLPSQKSRYLQSKIKSFRVILQVFGRISTQHQVDTNAS